jgi:hypothetical protein
MHAGRLDTCRVLAAWAERTGRGQVRAECRGGLRFAFYGRVSTEEALLRCAISVHARA